jgi:hypothetical protein
LRVDSARDSPQVDSTFLRYGPTAGLSSAERSFRTHWQESGQLARSGSA